MNSTSSRSRGLRLIPLVFLLLTALACPAFSEDIKALIKKAEGGDAEAQFILGTAYGEGRDVPQDFSEAAKWYRKAAEQGHARAQFNLASAYANGEGVP